MKYRNLKLALLLLVATSLAGGCSWGSRIERLETYAQAISDWTEKLKLWQHCHVGEQTDQPECVGVDPPTDPPPGPLW
jgi:hypothetical protein